MFSAKNEQLSSQDEYQNSETYSLKAFDSLLSMYFSGVAHISKLDKILSEFSFQIPYITKRNAYLKYTEYFFWKVMKIYVSLHWNLICFWYLKPEWIQFEVQNPTTQ